MKRLAFFVACALLLMAPGQGGPTVGGWGFGGNPRGASQSPAFFEFAPASGAGMGTACACTVPTGSKGQPLTFTRSGSATCSKVGAATTGIANGDIVLCGGNQPRIEPSAGALAIRMEAPRTNAALQSQSLDLSPWLTDTSPAATVTVTANAATAPDGTVTADRLEFPARSGTEYAVRYQPVLSTSSGSVSIYVRGNGQSGSISLAADGALSTAIDCAYVSTEWRRCVLSAANTRISVGSVVGYGSTSGSKPALDVFLWGAQVEGTGFATHATSYIPTTVANVTRNAEALSVNSFSLNMTNGSFALTSSIIGRDTLYGVPLGLTPPADGWQFYNDYTSWNGFWSLYYSFTFVNPTAIAPYSGTQRLASWRSGGAVFWNIDGVQGSTVRSGVTTVTGVTIGGDSGASDYYTGHISRVCIDSKSSTCR